MRFYCALLTQEWVFCTPGGIFYPMNVSELPFLNLYMYGDFSRGVQISRVTYFFIQTWK